MNGIGGCSMWPRTHVQSHHCKNVATCGPDYLRTWWSLYLELSACFPRFTWMWLGFCLLAQAGMLIKNYVWIWVHVVPKPFNMKTAITDVQVTHVMATNRPPYHHRCWLLNFAMVTVWMTLFCLCLKDTTYSTGLWFIWKCCHFASVHLRWAHPWEVGLVLDVVDEWLLLAW